MEKFLSASLPGEHAVPEEYLTYLLCKQFGWTPEYVEDMPGEWFALFCEFLRQEAKAGTLSAHRSSFYE